MNVVTDAAANLTPERAAELGVKVVPFQVTFNGQTYRDGVDIQPGDLYRMYDEFPNEYPETSQPSVGDLFKAYQEAEHEHILSLHLSSGLSGAYSSAEHAARMTPEKQVTVIDSRTVGPALGWMVEAAAIGVQRGWPFERILEAIQLVKENTLTMVAFTDMKYLIHSGRVSHLKSIIASMLRIKPIIGMNAEDGRYSSLGQEMTMQRLVRKMAGLVHNRFGEQKLRLQLMYGNNMAGADQLREALHNVVTSVEDKVVPVTLVLGAHAGPTVFGLAAAPQAVFDRLYE